MTQNTAIEIEIIKVESPRGYESRHLWAVMVGEKKVAEIVPDISYRFANGITRTTIGYTLYSEDGTEIADCGRDDGKSVSLRKAFNVVKSHAIIYAGSVSR